MYSHGEINLCKDPLAAMSAICPKSISNINGILVELKQRFNISVLLIEQNVALAQSFCDRCVMMEQGMISQEFNKENNIDEIEKIMFNK